VARLPLRGQHGHRAPSVRPASPPPRAPPRPAAAAAAERFRRHGLIERGEHVRRRPEAERRGGHTKDVGLLDTSTRRVAVIPGLSFRSELGASMMVA
jgi:hypothetical protein